MSLSNVLLFLIGIAFVIIRYRKWGYGKLKKGNGDIFKKDSYLLDALMRIVKSRRRYYQDIYLQSNAWKRKRYLVLKRDNWRCVHCGAPATQVHHKKYAGRKIGKEPIEWLESVCTSCHSSFH